MLELFTVFGDEVGDFELFGNGLYIYYKDNRDPTFIPMVEDDQ